MSRFWYRFFLFIFLLIPVLLVLIFNRSHPKFEEASPPPIKDTFIPVYKESTSSDSVLYVFKVEKDIKIKNYFAFIDDIVLQFDSLVPYILSEHLLVQANDWIIDSLVATDYYTKMADSIFVYDQKELVILHAGDSILIPDCEWADLLELRQNKTLLDINVPEFTLRIMEGEKIMYSFPVRVGQNKERYLLTAKRIENLRTRRGIGSIYKITRDPIYMNPVDGHHYESTARDDGQRTKLPQIPFLHPMINGHRWGQLIHPTTNQKTLGKAYSNGCIGTGEGAAWRIYYHAPVGTAVKIRYDLEVVDEHGDSLRLKDIYW